MYNDGTLLTAAFFINGNALHSVCVCVLIV